MYFGDNTSLNKHFKANLLLQKITSPWSLPFAYQSHSVCFYFGRVSSISVNRTSSEEKHSKSLPEREPFGSRARPTQLLSKLTPKPHLRQFSSQTSSLLSSSSITDDSEETTSDDDESEEIHAYDERRHKRHQPHPWY